MSTMICTPKISFQVPNVSLPFGAQFQAVADFSKGPPSQCAMLSSLLVQITPALAAMNPILQILQVFSAMLNFVKSPLTSAGEAISAITNIIEMITPATFVPPVKSILLLVVGYLECFVQTMEGLLEIQGSIDLSIAAGNPDLTASLQCASNNVQVSISQLMQSLGPIGPILELVQPFISIIGSVGISIPLPSISSLQGSQDIEGALKTLSTMLTDLQQVLEAIPG
jgi:hypothetical protein